MASVTLTTFRARVRERADMVGSTFVTDAATSLDAFINASLQELYDIVIQKFGSDYFVSSSAFVTVSGTSSYALPADFYKLLGVDLKIGSDDIDLKKFEFKERNLYKSTTYNNASPGSIRYRLEGSNLRLYPAPQGAYNGTIWYVPTLATLVNGGDAVNFPNGWEEYAIIDAAIKCLVKEESDASALMAAKAGIIQRIEAAAENRDAGEPERVVDVTAPFVGFDPLWRV